MKNLRGLCAYLFHAAPSSLSSARCLCMSYIKNNVSTKTFDWESLHTHILLLIVATFTSAYSDTIRRVFQHRPRFPLCDANRDCEASSRR